jgi:predicted ATPase/DNA-binding SARP family transcriptional activator
MDGELQLALFGEPFVARGDAPVGGFAYKKSLALLAYLAVTGQAHARERLAGLLWGEATDANALASLRKALADLRDRVEPHLVITRHDVAFDRECPYWLDVEAFERRVDRAVGQVGGALTAEDAASLARAVELYRGDFLEGFYVHRAPAYEEWVLLQRERLRLSMLRALHALAAHYAARGAYGPAIGYVARVLALEPAQEEAHREMMSLLARSGQQGAALRQYEVCRQVLAEALDVVPDRETTALYERIRAGGAGSVAPSAAAHNLPASLTPLVGRGAELAEIAARLGDPGCRLLTLVGPGGAGKTHLAQVAAAAQRERFSHGVYWVPLASLDAPKEIASAIAQALGLPFHDEGTPQEQLHAFMRHKQVLLAMDGLEHLLAGVDLLVDLLQAAPGVKLLATSRVRLNAGCEQLLPVGGLSCPEAEQGEPPPECPADAAQQPAVQLFLAGAQRVQPGFTLAEGDLSHVVRICRQADGLPLAILLAAGWAGALTPAEIAAQLCEGGIGLDFLAAEWHDLPQRQRSMRAICERSWGLLSPREQDAFATLSVFRGGFDGAAARQVAGASPRELLALVEASFLQHTAQGRYEVHELLRQCGAEQLARSPAAEKAARDRHCATYAARLRDWGQTLKGANQQAALDEMTADLGNARAAWERAVEVRAVEQLDRAVEGLCSFYGWVGRYQDGARACRTALERLDADAGGDALRVRARIVAWHAVFGRTLGRFGSAAEQLRHSLALLEGPSVVAQDVRPERAFAMLQLGIVLRHREGREAEEWLRRSLALYRELGDRWSAARALEYLGYMAMTVGGYEDARRLYGESLALDRELGDRRGMSGALSGLSTVAQSSGELAEGVRLIQQSIAICEELGVRVGVAYGLYVLGTSLSYLGELEQARAALERSIPIYDELGLRGTTARLGLAYVKILMGQYPVAWAEIEALLPLDPGVDDWGTRGLASVHLGMLALVEGAYGEARRHCVDSAAAFRQFRRVDLLGVALARRHLVEALQIGLDKRSVISLIVSLIMAAPLLADEGAAERAVALHATVAHLTSLVRSPWVEDVAGRHIAAAAAALPPEVAAAARERGRAQDARVAAAALLAELKAHPILPADAA